MPVKSFEQIVGKKQTLSFEEIVGLEREDTTEPLPDIESKDFQNLMNWATDERMSLMDAIQNYPDYQEWESPDPKDILPPDIKPERMEELGGYRGLSIMAAPEETGVLSKIFGYEPMAKPEHYWEMGKIKRSAFDFYMAGRHILTRIGGRAAIEIGVDKKNVKQLYDDEIRSDIKWYHKSPEAAGLVAEKVAEYYALKGIFKATRLHRSLSWVGQKLAHPFIAKELVARGGTKVLPVLTKQGMKRLTFDGVAAFLRFAPENTAFLSSWAAGSAALKDEDIGEAAISGALWGVGFSAIVPVVGGLGKVAMATKTGMRLQKVAKAAYVNLWIKHPRLMNAGRKPFSDEFLAELTRQYRARFGIEPTAADMAKLKWMSRVVGKEISKAAQKDAATKAYWESGKKAAQAAQRAKPPPVTPKEPPTPTETPAEAIKRLSTRASIEKMSPKEASRLARAAAGAIITEPPEKPPAPPAVEEAKPEVVEALKKKYDDKFDVELKKLGLYKVVKEGKAIGLPEVKRQKIRELKKTLRAEYEKELAQPPTEAKPAPPVAKEAWEPSRDELKAYLEKGKTGAAKAVAWSNYNLQPLAKARKIEVQAALEMGKPIPRQVLEEYKAEKWAQEALAKVAKVKPPVEISTTAKADYERINKKVKSDGLLALNDEEFDLFLEKNNVIPDEIDRSQAGFADFTPIIEAFEKTHDWILTFGEVKRTDPKLYDKLMKSFAERSASAERAISEIEVSVVEDARLSEHENAQLSLIFEDKKLSLPKELSEYAELFNKAKLLMERLEKISLKEGIFARPFQERMIEELTEKKEALIPKLKHPEASKAIQQINSQIETLKEMRYLPHAIIARRVIEEKLTTLTGEQRHAFVEKLSRISAKFKKRKGKMLLLKDYLDAGVISEEDIGFTKLITDSLADYYHRSSLKSLFDFAKEKGYVKLTTTALKKRGWLNQREIGIISPELKEQVVHPLLASALAEMKDMRRGRVGLGREILAMAKIGQFIKPTIIWIYNTVQKYMRGMYSLNPAKEAMALAKATRSVLTKDALYHKLNASNLYQFPYEVSRAGKNEQIKMFVRKHQKEISRLVSLVERSLGRSLAKEDMTFQRAVRTMITAAHQFVANTLTWTGDKIQRTQSYLILRKMKYPHDEAVKVASQSHVAYSMISHKFKKKMSPIVFVYSFRMLAPLEVMKTIVEPMVAAGQYVFSAGQKKPPKYKLERWAKAIAGTVIIPILVDTYMRERGFEPEGKHLGPLSWKYKKIVEIDGEERELVVGMNYILNLPVKYWNRLTYDNPITPESRWSESLWQLAKWEIHPIWRIFFWDIKQNKRSFGTGLHVYDPQASPAIQLGQVSKYIFGQSFRFWGGMMDAIGEGEMTDKERVEQEKIFDAALNKLDKFLFTILGYKYIRLPLEERQSIMASFLQKEMVRRAFEINRRYEGDEMEKRIEDLEHWVEKCQKWIEEGMK